MKRLQMTMRYVLSFLAIGFFLMITLATDVFNLLERSSNVTVAIKDCKQELPVTGELQVNILSIDSLGNPAPGLRGNLFVIHQKVRSDTCKFDVVFNIRHEFTTDANGLASYTGPEWIHDNSKDLWRVEIDWSYTSRINPDRQLQVKYYNDSEFFFTCIKGKLAPL